MNGTVNDLMIDKSFTKDSFDNFDNNQDYIIIN